jgi:hypothetical protein
VTESDHRIEEETDHVQKPPTRTPPATERKAGGSAAVAEAVRVEIVDAREVIIDANVRTNMKIDRFGMPPAPRALVTVTYSRPLGRPRIVDS